ncbi:SUKH-3 domain-containing protein [Eubacterium ruminantium]|uniref:SUKH-3 domain-containing protein n=1 Tax=Eubacterium ruminantium TaxID=42322 RepID=UPI00156A3C05|nr:SUKH-3 domain-containing protein [Eubacterium ruminantium]
MKRQDLQPKNLLIKCLSLVADKEIDTQNMRDALDVKEADSMKHVYDYEIRYNALNAEEFRLLWESAKGQPLTIEQARLAIWNTLFSVSMYDGDTIIAMARVIEDNGLCYYIKDVMVRLEYRAKGLDKRLIDELNSKSSEMSILIDDQYRHSPHYDEFFESFCKRLEKHFNDIPVFDAAMQFYKTYHFIEYSRNHNSVVCGRNLYDEAYRYLNGIRLEEVVRKLVKDSGIKYLPAACVHLKKGFFRFILINEKSEFYLDDGTYLGTEYKKIVESILSGEKEVVPIRNDRIFTSLERHGWNPDKIIDTAPIEDKYRELGFSFFPAAKKFFEVIPTGKYKIWVPRSDDDCYIGFYPNKRMKDPKEFRDEIGEDLLTIASKREADFFISESGKFYVQYAVHNQRIYVTDDLYLFIYYLLINWNGF